MVVGVALLALNSKIFIGGLGFIKPLRKQLDQYL